MAKSKKSYVHQSLPQKRLKKLAARYSDEEIRASLQEDDDNIAYIDERGPSAVGYWNVYCGPLAVMNDDPVLAYAQVEYLRRNEYPCFSSERELQSYAEQNGWPRKVRRG